MSTARNKIPVPVPGQRNVLITSALPYVNNVPHLGNLIGSVLSADVYARYCRLLGFNTLFVCGTDEYGTATAIQACKEEVSPQTLCNNNFIKHRDLYAWFQCDFDIFGRTSTKTHTELTHMLYNQLNDSAQGKLIKEQLVEQWFCNGCKMALADRFVEGICPHCSAEGARGDQCDACGKLIDATNLIHPQCKICNDGQTKLQLISSKHLFLNLPKLHARLWRWYYEKQKTFCWSSNAVAIAESWLKKDDLHPRCITRDLNWGTPVPRKGYENKVFYVWFDAPIGYISITAHCFDAWKQWWQNPEHVELVQFMGKDNVPFHTIMFPATLLGTGKPWTTVSKLFATHYLQYEGGKFSKSRNRGIFCDQAKDIGIPSDVWRYVLLANRPEKRDSNFTWKDLQAHNNAELLNVFGNFCHRVLSFMHKFFDGKLPKIDGAHAKTHKTHLDSRKLLLSGYIEAMEHGYFRIALKKMMAIAREGNQSIQSAVIWDWIETDRDACAMFMLEMVDHVYLLAHLAWPFMPVLAQHLFEQLNTRRVPIGKSFLEMVPFLCSGHILGNPKPLISKINDNQVAMWQRKYGNKL